MRVNVGISDLGYVPRCCCYVCGDEVHKNSVQAVAFDEDGAYGLICHGCLESRDGLIARARAHAANLRVQADALDTVTTWDMPTLASQLAAEQANDNETARFRLLDLETKVAILKKYAEAEAEAVPLPDDVAMFIADKIYSNIRELQGALIRVDTYASLAGQELSLELAQHVLKNVTDAVPA